MIKGLAVFLLQCVDRCAALTCLVCDDESPTVIFFFFHDSPLQPSRSMCGLVKSCSLGEVSLKDCNIIFAHTPWHLVALSSGYGLGKKYIVTALKMWMTTVDVAFLPSFRRGGVFSLQAYFYLAFILKGHNMRPRPKCFAYPTPALSFCCCRGEDGASVIGWPHHARSGMCFLF